MENASKALIMAAGVLIGMLILSLAVYLFVSFGSTSAQIHQEKEQKQINKFNTQFTSYVGKESITIYDVVSVANLATENNIYYEFKKRKGMTDGKDNYISVQIINNNLDVYNHTCIEKGYESGDIDYNQLIDSDLRLDKLDLTQYTCTVEISPTTQRVYKVIFKAKN